MQGISNIMIYLVIMLVFGIMSLNARLNEDIDLEAVSGWRTIKNINDPQVMKIAEFAVSEYNKIQVEMHKVVKVIKAKIDTSDDTLYGLIITTETKNAKLQDYFVEVVYRPSHKYLSDISLIPAGSLTGFQ
ncbi:hypothetical protein RND81_10G001700 [Saponaria officinalis]|uniref:Cystatin domain-containing protein n=1 Tax=Saponaria officinalis TaxID=3572 RepID=A0AAW1HYM3_SAPOF